VLMREVGATSGEGLFTWSRRDGVTPAAAADAAGDAEDDSEC